MDDNTVDNWEDADLDLNFTKLVVNDPASKDASGAEATAKLETPAESGPADTGSATSEAKITPPKIMAAKTIKLAKADKEKEEPREREVDSFLREALQDQRQRMTVLKYDLEVTRFLDSSLEQFETAALSSYQRKIVHTVAQYYCLQSTSLQPEPGEEPHKNKILMRKVRGQQMPEVRLSDIRTGAQQAEERTVAPRIMSIKRRPTEGEDAANGARSAQVNVDKAQSMKTVEERKEEYAKARERIFASSANKAAEPGTEGDEARALPASIAEPEAGSATTAIASEPSEALAGPPPSKQERKPKAKNNKKKGGNKDQVGKEEAERGDSAGNEASVNGQNGGGASGRGDGFEGGKGGNGRPERKNSQRVAIFRDREKDSQDPDFNRNMTRYQAAYVPPAAGPQHAQMEHTYASSHYNTQALAYTAQFPALGQAHPQHQPMHPPQHPPAHAPHPKHQPPMPPGAHMQSGGAQHAAPHGMAAAGPSAGPHLPHPTDPHLNFAPAMMVSAGPAPAPPLPPSAAPMPSSSVPPGSVPQQAPLHMGPMPHMPPPMQHQMMAHQMMPRQNEFMMASPVPQPQSGWNPDMDSFNAFRSHGMEPMHPAHHSWMPYGASPAPGPPLHSIGPGAGAGPQLPHALPPHAAPPAMPQPYPNPSSSPWAPPLPQGPPPGMYYQQPPQPPPPQGPPPQHQPQPSQPGQPGPPGQA